MNKLIWLVSFFIVEAIVGCSKGTSRIPSNVHNTQYDLQNYLFDAGVYSSNCILEDRSMLNCDSKGILCGIYSISFSTPIGKPSAYVVMPPSDNTYGLKIKPISGCQQVPAHNGEIYKCNFTIVASGTAQAGGMVKLKISGELGDANIVIINLH